MSVPHTTAGTQAAIPVHSGRRRHVDIVSGSFGAGHDAAARAIAEQLHSRGVPVRIWDVVDLMPGRAGRLLRSGYLAQVQAMPATWRWTLEAVDRRPGLARILGQLLATTEDALRSMAASGPAMIVSTHPFPSQTLGSLRARRLLHVPVTTYLTDMSVHPLWVHPGVDFHLAIHAIPAQQAQGLNAEDTRVVTPAVHSSFDTHSRTTEAMLRARAVFGLAGANRVRLALVTGGSCGIGQLYRSAHDIARTGLATPVVLCGTNDRLLARVRRNPGMIGVGWVGDMPRLLAAVDVVVQNSGGMTTLEAQAAGVPLLTYRSLAGHGEANAASLDSAGLAPWVRGPEKLFAHLSRALSRSLKPRTRVHEGWPTVADALCRTPALIA